MRLICESCNRGYPHTLQSCMWCGCDASLAYSTDDASVIDTECYINYWLCRFDTGETFEMFPGFPLDVDGLQRALSRYTLVSFNGAAYDLPMIAAALAGYTTEQLKAFSDDMIQNGTRHYDALPWVDHIDLFNVLPGDGSLKAYGAKMHTKTLQDLPYEPETVTHWAQRFLIKEYCGNDLKVTREAFDKFQAQLKLRDDIGAEYGLDVRSKSDAQIAEAVMKKIVPFKIHRPSYHAGTEFYYRPPAWLKFVNLDLIERLAMLPFSINENGGVSPNYHADFIDWGDDQVRLDGFGRYVKRPTGWVFKPTQIGQTMFTMGIGGLHSCESQAVHWADQQYVIRDHDVASYYPSLILITEIAPAQIGTVYSETYRGWYYRRMGAKKAGDKKTANSLKTLLNGTFGKLNDKYSIFYAPPEMLQVTLTGQLALLMLIEQLELNGIPVISANTDGIVLKCPRVLEWLADELIRWWESVTQFETERTDYAVIASRDVNSYIAIKTDGEVKLKGAYAPAEPGPSGWPNPTGQICVTAAVEFIRAWTPIEQTIRTCTDFTQFVYVRAVRGGGVLNRRPMIPKKTTKTRARELLAQYGFDDYAALLDWSQADQVYLGKVVRWYYAAGSTDWIQYKTSGNMVPRSQGCRPCMVLPETVPDDIDYQWYINEANELLKDMGVKI